MVWQERLLHALLFEATALLFSVLLLLCITQHGTTALSSTLFIISLIAVLWNIVFNWVFDQFARGERLKRPLWLRILHALLFEITLLIYTLPVIAYILAVDWLTAFIMDIGITLFILVYTVIFNWVYDHLRLFFINTH